MAAVSATQPKITLHWLEVSRSHRILWLLEELKIPYELKTWKRTAEKRADPKLEEIHPLGKSPILTVEVPGRDQPLVLIESANIVEFLCEHYGKWLIPSRYQPGKEDQVGGETETFLRYRTFMHYAEGSIMPLMVFSLLVNMIRTASVPFFIRPITNTIAGRLEGQFLKPNFKTHYKWLESQLATTPDGGPYICGKDITAADILMSFPLEAGEQRSGLKMEDYPRVAAYLELLHQREAHKKSVEKIKEIEGTFVSNL